MSNKKIIVSVIIVAILAVALYQTFFKEKKTEYTLAEVVRGNVTQEITETGQVQKGDKINLTFKNAGRIERIFVVVGEDVKAGDVLAKLDNSQLSIQLQEAKAALSLVQSQLNKLLAGATAEEIKIVQTGVQNKLVALNTANQNLQDAYEDSLNVLSGAYLYAYNAQNFISTLQRTYFFSSDQEGIRVKESKEKIESSVLQIKSYLDQAQATFTFENTDQALSQVKSNLSQISVSLNTIRESCEAPLYRSVVSGTDKTLLETHQSYINTSLTSVTNSQQSIISYRLAVEAAEGNLQAAQDDLALTTASPRQEDVEYHQAQVEQAHSQVLVLESQTQDSYLRAPLEGQVITIKKRVGELVQPVLQDVVMTLMPAVPYEIEVDIYEEDIVKMAIGNPVDIELIALPGRIFQGRLVSIDPAEELIEGVVYYTVTINFDEEMPSTIKPGMTADVVIKTASKENVLTIPEDAIQKKDDKNIVKVFRDGEVEEREIKMGLKGSDDMVEVISGLEEGEKVIVE